MLLFKTTVAEKSLLELNKVLEREKMDVTSTQTIFVQITSRGCVVEAGQRLQIRKDWSIFQLDIRRGEKTADIKISKQMANVFVCLLRAVCGPHTRWYRCQFLWRIGSLAEGEPT